MDHAIGHAGHTREKKGLGSARVASRRRNRACSLLVLVLELFRKEERVQQGSDQILSKMCMGLHSFSSKHKGQQE
jgi:hypothetical protein